MISITYDLRISLFDDYSGDEEFMEMRPVFATNTPEFTDLLENFKQQVMYNNRTYFLPNRIPLDPDERNNHFLVKDHGLFRIHEENLEFSYFDHTRRRDAIPTIFEGILRVRLVVEPLESAIPELDQVFIETLIWDSFKPTFDFTPRQLVFNYKMQRDYLGTYVQVIDTPENVVFSVRNSVPVLK